GFAEAGHRPAMLGFQAAGAAPLVLGAPVEHPETVASAIRIGNPARWEDAMAAMSASAGAIRSVTDEQILDAYRYLAAAEGVFCEPASAAALSLQLEVEVRETGSFAVHTALEVARDRSNLVVQGFERLHSADAFEFEISSEIPLSGGLGSSAAAVLAGLMAADHIFELDV